MPAPQTSTTANQIRVWMIQPILAPRMRSEILFPARIKTEIDWDTVNRLVTENADFSTFLKLITEDCKLGKVKSEYDKVLNVEELTKHIKDKGIKHEL